MMGNLQTIIIVENGDDGNDKIQKGIMRLPQSQFNEYSIYFFAFLYCLWIVVNEFNAPLSQSVT